MGCNHKVLTLFKKMTIQEGDIIMTGILHDNVSVDGFKKHMETH